MANIYGSFNQAQQRLSGLEAIDYFFAKEMHNALVIPTKVNDEHSQHLFHLFIVLSSSLRAGHTCLPITEISDIHWANAFDEQGLSTHQGYKFPSSQDIDSMLTTISIGADAAQPLVFEHNRLYLRRYFQFENELAQSIKARIAKSNVNSIVEIKAIVTTLFANEEALHSQVNESQELEVDWQKVAVANAMNKNFTVIAGGPGTGKTYTVTKLLAALLMLNANSNEQTAEPNQPLEIALVAPTGKAAQRLSESIIKAIKGFKGLIADEILALMPTKSKTIHRLLGVIPNSPNFRHHQANQLSCDVLLIDEVSMVDLPMMTRLVRALKPEAKIILLGDADQLPSVAVGSVLADIAPRPHGGYSSDNLEYLAQVCQIPSKQFDSVFQQEQLANTNPEHCIEQLSCADHVSFLRKSRRFDGEGGIGQLASFVIQGQTSQSWQLLNESDIASTPEHQEPKQLQLVAHDLSTWLLPLINNYYREIAKCKDIDHAFTLLAKFRVLCVTRQGEFGVDALNYWIKEQLVSRFELSQNLYHGMPIMISENDYRLGLYNGDIGLLWRSEDGHLMAYFENTDQVAESVESQEVSGSTNGVTEKKLSPNNAYKILLPSRLPKYDSVYAMTIHKTQGSEFEHVAIVLPKQAEHQLLSRELLYTGITRAKQQLTMVATKQTWQYGVSTAIKRHSGLNI
ncbi:exodeoxyribonuclease V subunit alpha [Colwellia sp. KU-HH00111]|uniref:exodeoxyribonuclease V subunit alpha n=1 Tax=Colwellia sp. KU-HH00111 TaxID=3127652 RepID=UPI00310B90EA